MTSQVLSGTTIGSAILFFFGAVWMLLGLFRGRPLPLWLRTGLLFAGLALAVAIGLIGMRAAHLACAAPPHTAEQSAAGHRMGRRFGWITVLEGAAIFLTVVLLNVLKREDAILSVIAIIVGLHFFPLAGLFEAPVYYATGLLGCAIGVVGLLISDSKRRHTLVGLSFGLLLWLTAAAMLAQVFLLSST